MSTLVSNLFDIINLLGIASSIEINSGTVCRFHQQTGVGSGEFPFNQPVTGPRLTTTLTLLTLPVKGGLALLLLLLRLLLHLRLTKLDPLPCQHVTQPGHRLLQHLAGLSMLYHKMDVGLAVGSHMDLDLHLAKAEGVELNFRLLQFLGQHHIDLLVQFGGRFLTGQFQMG